MTPVQHAEAKNLSLQFFMNLLLLGMAIAIYAQSNAMGTRLIYLYQGLFITMSVALVVVAYNTIRLCIYLLDGAFDTRGDYVDIDDRD